MKISYGETVANVKLVPEALDRVNELWLELKKKADGEFKNFEDFLYLSSSTYVPEISFSSNLKHVILIGIGGSSLSPKAVYDALFGHFDNVQPKRSPKMHFLDNVDSKYTRDLMEILSQTQNYDELAFVIVCKSGRTFETLEGIGLVTKENYRGVVNGNNTYVVSVEGNNTWEWGKKFNAKLFPMPKMVSGRFAVFSGVAVVPLGLVGVEATKFLEGAKHRTNDAVKLIKLVSLRYEFYNQGLVSDVYYVFDDRLKSLGEWMSSITAESLGKNGAGITPIVSVGSKDNHSMLQLYLQGRRDKFTTFLSLTDTDEDNLLSLAAVKKAYDEAELPYTHLVLESSSPEVLTYSLGDFMQSWMVQTVLLGGLMGINPYDQPGVEIYKKYLMS